MLVSEIGHYSLGLNQTAAVEFAAVERSWSRGKLLPNVRLVLVDDNPSMLETLVEMLQRDFTIAGTFSTGAAFLAEVSNLNPDVVLLDVSLGDMTGFYVAKRLKSVGCTAKIIFLSVHENPDFVRAAFEFGASGYVFKSQVSLDLRDAVEAVSRGARFVPLRSASSTC